MYVLLNNLNIINILMAINILCPSLVVSSGTSHQHISVHTNRSSFTSLYSDSKLV